MLITKKTINISIQYLFFHVKFVLSLALNHFIMDYLHISYFDSKLIRYTGVMALDRGQSGPLNDNNIYFFQQSVQIFMLLQLVNFLFSSFLQLYYPLFFTSSNIYILWENYTRCPLDRQGTICQKQIGKVQNAYSIKKNPL